MKLNTGFTLAEVLITLGIIGVVVAMTMPVLMQSAKKSEATARLKKFNTIMQQAIIMSELDNGESKSWEQNATSDTVTQSMTTEEFFLKYLGPYIKYLNVKKAEGAGITVYLADGSRFQIFKATCMDILYDINGDKNPNKFGHDIFRFLICPNSSGWCDERKFCSYYASGQYNRTKMLQNCKTDGNYCSGLLEYDGWEFKKDYPYRL